jgi:hypothetical protein
MSRYRESDLSAALESIRDTDGEEYTIEGSPEVVRALAESASLLPKVAARVAALTARVAELEGALGAWRFALSAEFALDGEAPCDPGDIARLVRAVRAESSLQLAAMRSRLAAIATMAEQGARVNADPKNKAWKREHLCEFLEEIRVEALNPLEKKP